MACSTKPADPAPARDGVLDSGEGAAVACLADPYAQLDDLMCVVEALCPVWPDRSRHPVQGAQRFLL